MTSSISSPPPAAARELADWLSGVRDQAFWLGLIGLYGGALAVIGSPQLLAQPDQYLWIALFCFAVIGASWLARTYHGLRPRIAGDQAATWLLAVGAVVILLLTALWGGFTEAAYLLALPVGLIFLGSGVLAGAGLALVCTLALAIMPGALSSSGRVVAAMMIFGSAGMLWVLRRSLVSAIRWAWLNYEQAQASLAEARDQRLKLAETIHDLQAANAQMTRLNRLARALRQAAEDERRTKEQFVANVSHELRTPLNMIIGYCEMMTSAPQAYNGGRIPRTMLADLDVVLRNSRHLAALIDDVLDLSQIEAGRMALTKEHVELAALIEAAAIAVRPLYASKGLCLEVEVAPDLPVILCDRTRIREVLLNLLSNAGRFTERGGVKVKAWVEGEDVVVSVADTGPGIAEEDQERLFRPFEQLDGSIRRRYGGTGLGLSISRGFVELHQGKMWVESELGQGATFFFCLPIEPSAPADSARVRWLNPYSPYEERTRPMLLPPQALRPRFVVVETGAALSRLLERYLHEAEIAPVDDLKVAVQELAESPAAALLVNDLAIGQTFDRLANYEQLPDGTPAIVFAIPGAENAAVSLGVSDYLVKPIAAETLLAALDRLGRPVQRILVVDDEPDALQLFSRILAEAGRGYRVQRAENGRQALQLAAYERPDVILLDLVMPEMDGFAFLAARRKDPALHAIPIILISARDPQGQPIISKGLAVVCRRGLSAQEVLACIRALTSVLSRSSPPPDPAAPETPHG